MNRYIALLLFVFGPAFSLTAYCQSFGLQFSSHETVQEKRTSFNLTPDKPVCLRGNAEISFDFMLQRNMPIYFGYIIRVITTQNKNIDIVYNEPVRQLNFVTGEKSVSFPIDSIPVFDQWNRFVIHFDEKEKTVAFIINDKELSKSKTDIEGGVCGYISFGVNTHTGFQTPDVPPMLIREVKIKEGKTLSYYYPLNENRGEEALEKISGKKYKIVNPVWISPLHQNWQWVYTNKVPSTPSIAFDKQRDLLYIIGADSLYELSVKGLTVRGTKLSEKRNHLAAGSQSVYNPFDGRLYNFYIDEKSVSIYDSVQARWDKNFRIDPLTEFWQANKFISPVDTGLYTVAGYGQLHYKNLIQRYSFSTGKWDTIRTTGDFFTPRYLAALGLTEKGDTAYILGGYGSKTGAQALNPRPMYDLLAFSIRDKKITAITQLKEPASPFCFSNSMVLEPGTDNYYTLIYPNDRFNSRLQLIKGSLHSPEYEPMADTIPYLFYDVESFVDLLYSPVSKKLIAVTLHTGKDSVTDINIYTLNFPPNKMIAADTVNVPASPAIWTYIIGALALAAAGIVLYWYNKKKKTKNKSAAPATIAITEGVAKIATPTAYVPAAPAATAAMAENTAAVFLFGQFEILNKQKQNVTPLFSPLLKELFLLILIHTYKDGKGISAEKLLEILWSDKSPKDARNNYQVNIAKLRTVCEKIGSCNISKDSGQLKIELEDEFIFIDYKRFSDLTNTRHTIDNIYVPALLEVIQRGGFLVQLHYSWLDDFKSEVSGKISDIFYQYVSAVDLETNAELIARFANAVFLFDQLNEEALIYKCKSLIALGRHGMAKDAFSKFAKEYKENYGTDFEKTFAQITNS